MVAVLAAPILAPGSLGDQIRRGTLRQFDLSGEELGPAIRGLLDG